MSGAAAIPQIKTMLALSDAELSLALLAMAGGAIVMMPLAGALAHRLGGPGVALRYASVCFGLSLCLPGLAANLPILIGLTNGFIAWSMSNGKPSSQPLELGFFPTQLNVEVLERTRQAAQSVISICS